jgi:hypothetical protein
MIPATPGPKIPENGPEPEFRLEYLRNFEPSTQSLKHGRSNEKQLVIWEMTGMVQLASALHTWKMFTLCFIIKMLITF